MLKISPKLRKVIAIAICLAGSATIIAQEEIGVKIGDLTWATRNVDMPGKFVDNPEDMGMFYQWNNKVGWTTTGVPSDGIGIWDNKWNGNGVETWEETNNVCPTGWRIPTNEELTSLVEFEIEWIVKNGVSGCTFSDNDNTIFLPVTGDLFAGNGNFLGGIGGYSFYWGSTTKKTDSPYYLEMSTKGLYVRAYKSSTSGHSIRCVKDESNTTNLDDIVLSEKSEIVGFYNIMGQKLPEEPKSGLYIILYSNGQTEKRIKK